MSASYSKWKHNSVLIPWTVQGIRKPLWGSPSYVGVAAIPSHKYPLIGTRHYGHTFTLCSPSSITTYTADSISTANRWNFSPSGRS